jgi:hypothetical protein
MSTKLGISLDTGRSSVRKRGIGLGCAISSMGTPHVDGRARESDSTHTINPRAQVGHSRRPSRPELVNHHRRRDGGQLNGFSE